MNVPANNSPFWGIARMLVVGGFTTIAMTLFLAFGYQNHWSASDWKTVGGSVLTTLVSLGAFDKIKTLLTTPATSSAPKAASKKPKPRSKGAK